VILPLILALNTLRVDAVFKQYNAPNVPGCALGVFRNGVTAYARGYGMADLEHNVHITPASLFDVGSVSKQFAAAAIALLAGEGRLAFTDDIRKYIPELPDYGAAITLNELMWHTSGLRDYTDLLDLEGYGLEQATTDGEALAAIVRQRNLEFPSGSRYEYSNTNYFLLSVIVKRVTGQTLAEFARRRMFLPLGMNHTVYRTDYAMLIPKRAMGYAPTGKRSFKNSMSNWEQTGDGAVQISIEDAAKWDENFYHPRVGGQRMIDELQTPGHLANGTRLHYARGLDVGTYRGLRLVSHGGAWIGYRAQFDRYPTVHTSIVVFCNSDAASPGTLARNVADIVLEPYLAHLPVITNPAAAKNTIAGRYLTGAYFDETGGEVYHVLAGAKGVALEAGGAAYPLTPAGRLSFRLGSTLVQFVLGENRYATALRLNGEEEHIVARKFTPVTPTAAQLAGASGNYYSPELDVTWRFQTQGRTVVIEPSRNLPDGAQGPLHPQLPDTFTSDGGFLIRFTRNSAGAITGFSLSAGRGLRSLPFTRA
jgi:CubicO group peptidase (beta-lactamase class C family)